MDRLGRKAGMKLAEEMNQEQPAVAAYLLGVDEDLLNSEERAELFFLGLAAWQIMKEGGTPLASVTVETLQQMEAKNVSAVEAMADKPDADATAILRGMLEDYAQPEVLASVLLRLLDSSPGECEEDEGIREESLGLMMLDLKTVVDALSA
jgi:hypothetical protein